MKSTLTKIALLFCIALISGACKHYQKIDVENIEKLYVDYNTNDPINYSKPFNAEIVMKMYTSEEVTLVQPKRFVSSENVSFDFSSKKAILNVVPTSFDKDFELVSLSLTDKNGATITSTDTIKINFNSAISAGFASSKGTNGAKGGTGGTSTITRNGKEGDSGANGLNGSNGDNYEVHIWKEGDYYFIHVKNITQNWIGKYKMLGTHSLLLNAQGGDGGNGGDGGTGGSGKDGEMKGATAKLPGNGGNGGNGGNAGNGGRGGDMLVVINPSAESIKPFLEIRNFGGYAGSAGSGGTGGQPGKPLSGQSQAKSGSNGLNGMNGQSGLAGSVNVQTTPFDPINYK